MPLFELGEVGDIGRRTGMALSIAAAGALAGPPISGAINHATGGFEAVGYYAGESYGTLYRYGQTLNVCSVVLGTMIMASVVLMLIVRHLVLRSLWGRF